MTQPPSSPPTRQVPSEPDDWADEAPVEEIKPLSREEALQWRARQPQMSAWRVVGWQWSLMFGVSLLAALVTRQASVVWSVFYGGLCIALPSALMAYGVTSSPLTRMVVRWFPGAARLSLAGVFLWEGIKVLLALAMMWSAPRWVPNLSWLGLVAGLVVVLKAYWLGFLFQRRRPH